MLRGWSCGLPEWITPQISQLTHIDFHIRANYKPFIVHLNTSDIRLRIWWSWVLMLSDSNKCEICHRQPASHLTLAKPATTWGHLITRITRIMVSRCCWRLVKMVWEHYQHIRNKNKNMLHPSSKLGLWLTLFSELWLVNVNHKYSEPNFVRISRLQSKIHILIK